VNELSKGHDFFEVGDIAISPDAKLMAWAEDTVGRRQYVARVMDLATREVYPIALPNVENNIVWAGDNQTFFYIEKDPKTLLGFRVRSHRLDSANHTDVTADPVVWTQEDESFYTQLSRTKDEKYLLIHTQSTVSTEVSVEIDREAAARGVAYVRMPISGNAKVIKAGRLSAVLSGADAAAMSRDFESSRSLGSRGIISRRVRY
jgi:protease II